jgi:cob(I)alamin adenosyltransferase
MAKIYTRRGDEGKTMVGGKMVGKDEQVIEALGAVDELNSWIGVCRKVMSYEIRDMSLDEELKKIQTNLFVIGSGISGSKAGIKPGETKHLERLIDKLSGEIPRLKNFIYPAGEMQVARAVCRRAERAVVKIYNDKNVLKYLNRLSDTLFVMGRWMNRKKGIKEEIRK